MGRYHYCIKSFNSSGVHGKFKKMPVFEVEGDSARYHFLRARIRTGR